MRARLDRIVQTGTVPCARCGQIIEPSSKWQLDHRDDGRGWLGPSHQKCNARAGWEAMIRSQNGNGYHGALEEQPYKWSQRWSEDPPPGTTVNISGAPGFVELYIGNGVWQTVNRRSVGY